MLGLGKELSPFKKNGSLPLEDRHVRSDSPTKTNRFGLRAVTGTHEEGLRHRGVGRDVYAVLSKTRHRSACSGAEWVGPSVRVLVSLVGQYRSWRAARAADRGPVPLGSFDWALNVPLQIDRH
jgi:hypothetical protein